MGLPRNIAAVGLTCTVFLMPTPPRSTDDPPQYSDWSAPTNLGPIVNTPGNDSGPCITQDGLTLYFNSDAPGGYGSLDIFVSFRDSVDEPWGPPQNLGPNINSPSTDNAPVLSPDEHWLYFQSARSGGFGNADLYVSRRHNRQDDFGWQPAENLGSPVNTSAVEAAPVYFEDEATGTAILYFHSNRPGTLGGNDIWVSTLQPDGTWGTPVRVDELSSPFNDLQPAIRRDGLEMFVTSNRPMDTGGGMNLCIWVSTRATTADPWQPPVNLGPLINAPSPGFQGRPSISFDGTALYFYAVRPGDPGAQGGPDLYVATREKLRGQPAGQLTR